MRYLLSCIVLLGCVSTPIITEWDIRGYGFVSISVTYGHQPTSEDISSILEYVRTRKCPSKKPVIVKETCDYTGCTWLVACAPRRSDATP